MNNNRLAKVSVVGAGNVGSTCAFQLAVNGIADVYLFDKFENIAQAKALDIGQAAVAMNSPSKVVAAGSLAQVEGSQVVVITAGMARKPGMTRADLIKINGDIAKDIAHFVKKHATDAVVIVVSNPLDVLNWIVLKETGFDRRRVFGMAGLTDNSRLRYFTSHAAQIDARKVDSHVLGVHADEMVIDQKLLKANEEQISEVLSEKEIQSVIKSTKGAGAQIVGLLGNGSAYYLPGTAAFMMARAVVNDTGETFDTSVYLEGEYGLHDVCLGVPAVIGSGGIKEIIELDLSKKASYELLQNSVIFKEQLKLL